MTDIEHVARALAWAARPVITPPNCTVDERERYWMALPDHERRLHLYRADIAIAAYEECHVAE